MSYKQGDIVLLPFPFTNQKGSKLRPASVVSSSSLNKSDDLIVVLITSQLNQKDSYAVPLKTNDLNKGTLNKCSLVKCRHFLNIDKSIIIKCVAELKAKKLLEVLNKVRECFV